MRLRNYWSGCSDSNRGPRRPKRRALPTAPHPVRVYYMGNTIKKVAEYQINFYSILSSMGGNQRSAKLYSPTLEPVTPLFTRNDYAEFEREYEK